MASETGKRPPGRPPKGRGAQLNFRIEPDAHAALTAKLAELDIGPTDFGVRFVRFFLSSPKAVQLAIIGRAGLATDIDWLAVARLGGPVSSGPDDEGISVIETPPGFEPSGERSSEKRRPARPRRK